jgi:hypothetical protein
MLNKEDLIPPKDGGIDICMVEQNMTGLWYSYGFPTFNRIVPGMFHKDQLDYFTNVFVVQRA